MKLKAESNSATIKKCVAGSDYLKDSQDLLIDINQNLICIQRQIYIVLKCNYQMLLELSKFGKFPEKALEINQQVIKEYLEKAKVEAEDTYQSEEGSNQK